MIQPSPDDSWTHLEDFGFDDDEEVPFFTTTEATYDPPVSIPTPNTDFPSVFSSEIPNTVGSNWWERSSPLQGAPKPSQGKQVSSASNGYFKWPSTSSNTGFYGPGSKTVGALNHEKARVDRRR